MLFLDIKFKVNTARLRCGNSDLCRWLAIVASNQIQRVSEPRLIYH
jgi:hypothetical protein